MFRHWRIQISLIFFTLLVAVIVLWVRSYSWLDGYGWVNNPTTTSNITSYRGDISFNRMKLATSTISTLPQQLAHVTLRNSPELEASLEQSRKNDIGFLGVHGNSNSFSSHVAVSYWFPAVFMAVLTGLPWYKRRFNFSLRTFFIAFTVLAVALGLIGWVFR